jgi:hypothetical protein
MTNVVFHTPLQALTPRSIDAGPEDWALGMSTDAGPRKFATEKAAIDAAYQAQLGEQFKAYFFNTVSGQRDEKDALAKFKAASEALRRAYVHALSVFSDHDL